MSFDENTIAEFRRNQGKVGGFFEGKPLLLLHGIGAKTGKLRVKPVMYLRDGSRFIVFASKGGHPNNPDWYHNLKAHPDIKIEVGDATIDVRAEEVMGPQRDVLYERQSKLYPQFADYQRKTKRIIPVIALARMSQSS